MYDSSNNGRVRRAWRKCDGQNRFSYCGSYISYESASAAGACKRRERSNRRRRSRRTYGRGVARRRPGSTASSASAAGLLCAGAGLCRRAGLPSGSGALLGWIWLAVSSSPGLRLIAAPFRASRRELTQVNQLEANWAPLFPALDMRSHGAWRHPPPVFRQSPFRARLPKSAFYIQFPPQKYPITLVCRPATGSMSALGHSRRFDRAPITSGLPPISGQFSSRLAFLKRANSTHPTAPTIATY
jgi:hypothetical protein